MLLFPPTPPPETDEILCLQLLSCLYINIYAGNIPCLTGICMLTSVAELLFALYVLHALVPRSIHLSSCIYSTEIPWADATVFPFFTFL